jgi:uncharacterized membrane protein YfcA
LGAIDPLFSLSGFLVGFLVGLTGVGGGSLMTPLLILFFGIHPTSAVGTDLLYAAATKTAGTIVHGAGHRVEWRIVGLLAIGSVTTTALMLGVLAYTGGTSPEVNRLITLLLGVMLVLTAGSLLARRWLFRFAQNRREMSARRQLFITIAFGAVLGVLVSISSVGAGAIGVTVLMLLYPRLGLNRIVGTDIAHAVPLTLIAGAGHWAIGDVDLSILASLLVGSIPGIVIASVLSPKFPEPAVRITLAVVLGIVGARMLFS